MDKFSMLWRCALMLVLSILLLACQRLTLENFNKIKPGMSLQEVIAIFGTPTSSENVMIGDIPGISAIWKDKNAEIDIQFLNDKVLVKSFSNTADDSTVSSKPHQKHKV